MFCSKCGNPLSDGAKFQGSNERRRRGPGEKSEKGLAIGLSVGIAILMIVAKEFQ